MDARQPLLIVAAFLALGSVGRASHAQYQVDAVFHPRPSVKLPGSPDPADQKALDEKLKKGFSDSIKVTVFASRAYTELPIILPDWGKLKADKRVNGWNEETFFAIGSGRATLGDSGTLARFIPLGQKLLLTGDGPPAQVFKALKMKASQQTGGPRLALREGIKELIWQGDCLQEDMVYPGKRAKLAEFRLVKGKNLEIRRFHPSGRILTTETWTPLKDLASMPQPDPIWEGWQVGSWVLDERDTSEPMHKRWQGYGREPSSADSKPIKGTTFRLTWLTSGLIMMIGGAAFLAYFSFRRKPPTKS